MEPAYAAPRPRPMSRARTISVVSALALTALLSLGACSDTGDSGGSSEPTAAREIAPGAADADGMSGEESVAATTTGAAASDSGVARTGAMQRAVISKGNVALRAGDVGQARFDVGKVVDKYGGEIAEENTETDREGVVQHSHLVVRVPADDFAAALDELKGIGTLINASSKSTDVTTQVIDVDVRVRAQRRSIERIQQLLARAKSIADIVAIETQLTQREAELQSLEQQQAHLADQTSMSTITVSLERTDSAREEDDDTGFLAGLAAGWRALAAFGVGVATVAGALLPWLVLLGLLGTPALLLVRRLRRPTASAP